MVLVSQVRVASHRPLCSTGPQATVRCEKREGALRTTQPNSSRLRRRIVFAAAVLVFLFLLLFGRGMLGRWTRYMGAGQMNVWAISDAQKWLEWSTWLMPGDGKTELMKAACFRHLEQTDRWEETMRSARQKGAPALQTQDELKLAYVQSGDVDEAAEQQLAALIQAGLPQQDVVAAFVHGCLARKETERAKALLDAWTADTPEDAHNAYMRGVYWRHLNESAGAMKEFERAAAIEPRHELARMAIAELYEEQGRLDQALRTFVELAVCCPDGETVRLGLARVLRKLSRVGEARAMLETLASGAEPSSAVSIEMGQIELECGHYQEAERWFARAHPAELMANEILASAGTTVALAGRPTQADYLFALIAYEAYVSIGIRDLQAHLLFDPNDRNAADALEGLSGLSLDRSAFADRISSQLTEDGMLASLPMSAPDLYALHCSACHGENGGAVSRATRYVFPKPRDLRAGKFRLVSTRNTVPTQEDVEAVIRRGMPGTSMRSFEDLSEDHQKLLAEEVLRIRREGIREAYINMLEREGEEIDRHEVDGVVEHLTNPGTLVRAPRFGPADAQAIEEGQALYFSQSCNSCHGKDGRGEQNLLLFDDERFPTRARDLAEESFKGGHEPEEVCRRILLGMPGTPHAASRNLTDEQLVDLVHYCRSLSREPKRALTNHQRAKQATGRAYLSALTESPGEE